MYRSNFTTFAEYSLKYRVDFYRNESISVTSLWTGLDSITNRCSGKEPFLAEGQRQTLEIRASNN